jgi:hypothetical protein
MAKFGNIAEADRIRRGGVILRQERLGAQPRNVLAR